MNSAVKTIAGRVLNPALGFPILLVALAFAFGGASHGYFLENMLIQIAAIFVLVTAVAGIGSGRFPREARVPLLIIAALGVLVVLQLLPLPRAVWAQLGGRELSGSVLDLIGVTSGWRALSVDPERTVLAGLALLPGVAMCVATLRLETRDRCVLAWMILFGAALSLMLGALQTSLGSNAGQLSPYPSSHVGQPIGLFANANHQGDLLLIGLVFAAGFIPPGTFRREDWTHRAWWLYGLILAFGAGVVATGSRMAIILLVPALVALVLRNRPSSRIGLRLGGAAALGLGMLLLVLYNPVFGRSFGDFSNWDDPRARFWPNVLWAISEFGWFGTGLGTFDGVYRSVETLDSTGATYVNHAHNDYLEIALEAGLPGVVLLLGFLILLILCAIRILRSADLRVDRALSYGGLVCIFLLMLHSLADYPLRTALLSTVFGFCCGLISPSPRDSAAQGGRPEFDGPIPGPQPG